MTDFENEKGEAKFYGHSNENLSFQSFHQFRKEIGVSNIRSISKIVKALKNTLYQWKIKV